MAKYPITSPHRWAVINVTFKTTFLHSSREVYNLTEIDATRHNRASGPTSWNAALSLGSEQATSPLLPTVNSIRLLFFFVMSCCCQGEPVFIVNLFIYLNEKSYFLKVFITWPETAAPCTQTVEPRSVFWNFFGLNSLTRRSRICSVHTVNNQRLQSLGQDWSSRRRSERILH